MPNYGNDLPWLDELNTGTAYSPSDWATLMGDPGNIFGDLLTTTAATTTGVPDYTGYGAVADVNYNSSLNPAFKYFSTVPWEDPVPAQAPGGYSIYEPFNQFLTRGGQGSMAEYLLNQGDPQGVFGDAISAWTTQNTAAQEAYNQQQASMSETGGIPYSPSAAGLENLTAEQVKAYFNSFGAGSNPAATQVVTSPTGENFLRYNVPGQKAPSWDEIAGQAFGMSAMGAMAGAAGAFPMGPSELFSGASNALSGLGTNILSGATSLGQALTGAGAADAAWGVNAALGAGEAAGAATLAEEAAALGLGGLGAEAAAGAVGAGAAGAGSTFAELAASMGVPLEAVSGASPLATLAGTGSVVGDLAAAGGARAAGAGSALSRILAGTGTSRDWLSTFGTLASTGLGLYGANQQADAYGDLAQQYMNMGAPYRDLLAQSYADPAGYLANSPDIQALVGQGTDQAAATLSAIGGNPAASGRSLQEIQNTATQLLYGQLGNERNRLANFGGLSAFNSAAPTANLASIGQEGNIYNALGYGLNNLLNPQPTLADLARSFGITGLA